MERRAQERPFCCRQVREHEHHLHGFGTKGIFDRKFAANTGLTFYTPEEYFLKEAPAQYSWGSFSPQDYLHPCTSLGGCGSVARH